ncbi:MAG: GNAT family acetyltransferase [Gammaproteobacteria bacterium]|nr:GNAT family acetyltransferase [Gammaproteobacteria bacterium]
MKNLVIRTFRPDDETDVIILWQQCGLIVPWNNPATDIQRKLSTSPDLFFVGLLDSELVASCMAGYDGHRGWIYFLAVKSTYQRQGIAMRLVDHAEEVLIKIGCPKIDLMVRNTNESVISFYKSVGYDTDPVVVLSKRLIKDEPHDYL